MKQPFLFKARGSSEAEKDTDGEKITVMVDLSDVALISPARVDGDVFHRIYFYSNTESVAEVELLSKKQLESVAEVLLERNG